MSWIIFAFGSVLFFTALNLLQRLIAVKGENPRAMAILFNGSAAIISLVITFLTGGFKFFVFPADPAAWGVVTIAALGYAIYERGRFTAAKLLDASVFATISNISVLVAFAGSLFLYAETMAVSKLLGGILIIGSLFLVSAGNKQKRVSQKGMVIGIIISIALGLAWMLDKSGVGYFNAITYNILMWTIPTLFIYLPGMKPEVIKKEFKLVSWKIFVLAGMNVAGYLMQLKAMETAEATRVIPIVQTSTLFTVLLGIIWLKEKENIYKKIIAGIMAVAGVYFLV
jgi:drug/metabolite transporter (DMT)-like permease